MSSPPRPLPTARRRALPSVLLLLLPGAASLLVWDPGSAYDNSTLAVPGAAQPLHPIHRAKSHRTPKGPAKFAEDFEYMYSTMDQRKDEPMSTDVQLVLGVFTHALEQEHRKVVRRTWWQQRQVCSLLDGQKPGCSVYVAFVIARDGRGSPRGEEQKELQRQVEGDPREEQGMLVLNVSENMNDGKSFHYFYAIKQLYPWATHVAKCDMDTYPAVHKLVFLIDQQSRCEGTPYSFAGRPGRCERHSPGCNGDLDPEFRHGCRATQGCWSSDGQYSYLSGQFYMMSMPLVMKTAVRMLGWERPPARLRHEDQVASFAVQSFTVSEMERDTCLLLWDPNAWCHNDRCTDHALFNDFNASRAIAKTEPRGRFPRKRRVKIARGAAETARRKTRGRAPHQ